MKKVFMLIFFCGGIISFGYSVDTEIDKAANALLGIRALYPQPKDRAEKCGYVGFFSGSDVTPMDYALARNDRELVLKLYYAGICQRNFRSIESEEKLRAILDEASIVGWILREKHAAQVAFLEALKNRWWVG